MREFEFTLEDPELRSRNPGQSGFREIVLS